MRTRFVYFVLGALMATVVLSRVIG